MKKRVPGLKSDKAAEAFLERDLSDLHFSQFKPMRFEFEKKTARVNAPAADATCSGEETRERAEDSLSALHPRSP